MLGDVVVAKWTANITSVSRKQLIANKINEYVCMYLSYLFIKSI